ncbi:hypothetical protein RIdsm_02687 [Roseovarius indicus]|uniref:Uncharacterized protein n=2 Tax=Roseovarius indicus TaxID=540747 RepID=A0A5P3ACF2_9RHOB|nr:hypothetical protein [Roseovarius indicus]QEW26881.1 hypothetical protein RIdsm_02687 [Roseovarius indicus]SFD58462.1 hypothetical protein SAMN04488031_101657 [Roseovarius indicus]
MKKSDTLKATMPHRATVTFHTHAKTKASLKERPLGNETLVHCPAEEEAVIASVKRGQEDARAGRVHNTDAARRRVPPSAP